MDFGNSKEYFGKPEPWVKHLSSRVEFLTSNCLDLVTGEDLTEGSPIWVDDETQQVAWDVFNAGYPRKVACMFVLRHDPLTGMTYTRIERT